MTESTRFTKCTCECHQVCHTCGGRFRGPDDYHINCGDMVAAQRCHFLSVGKYGRYRRFTRAG